MDVLVLCSFADEMIHVIVVRRNEQYSIREHNKSHESNRRDIFGLFSSQFVQKHQINIQKIRVKQLPLEAQLRPLATSSGITH